MEQVDRAKHEFLLMLYGAHYDFPGYNGELYYKQESDGCYYRATMKDGRLVEIQQVEPKPVVIKTAFLNNPMWIAAVRRYKEGADA